MSKLVHSFIKRVKRFSKINKPLNVQPRFKYDELPSNRLHKIIYQKMLESKNIPIIINGKIIDIDDHNSSFNGNLSGNLSGNLNGKINHYSPLPNNHNRVCYTAQLPTNMKLHDPELMKRARLHWNKLGIYKRIEIFESIANQILDNKNGYKDDLLTDTMIGQGKSLYEAEIDSVCELVDFLRFNNYYASEIMNRANQLIPGEFEYNFSEINGLNGFVAAITPFNFTAIAANLVSAPLLMGSPVIWKPSEYSLLSNYTYMKILLDNNIPPELISFIPCEPNYFLDYVSKQRDLAGIMFTGSSSVFDTIYGKIGENMNKNIYDNYPRLIGETGGKNYHFVHPSANINKVAFETFHSAFGYNGQKCSACSRLYLPKNMLYDFISIISEYLEEKEKINYASSHLISEKSYFKIKNELQKLDDDKDIKTLIGGYNYLHSNTHSLHIPPTILLSENHKHEIFNKEYFAPILAIYTYDGLNELDKTINICLNSGDKYALTGSIFANDMDFIHKCYDDFRFSAGNFYINTKSTGAVVGRQPFGGLGKSGTNDKAGDINFLYRLINQRTIKIGL